MRRLTAIAVLLLLAACAVVLVLGAVESFPRGLVIAALLLGALLAAWAAIRRRGAARLAFLAAGAGLLVAAIVLTFTGGLILDSLLAIGFLVAALALARGLFVVRTELPPAPRPKRPVVIWNPRSGGGKALQADLASQGPGAGDRAHRAHSGR